MSIDTKKDLKVILKKFDKINFKKLFVGTMKIVAAVIGMGIGEKHLKAIDGFLGSKVKIICERNKKKLKILRKKYPDKIVTSDENNIFLDKQINLVSLLVTTMIIMTKF